MHVLLINPNTSETMTGKVEALARAMLPMGWTITAASGRFGPRYIASRASFAVAGHAALDAYAAHGAAVDAVLLACFGDPGLDALRELAPVPVIGLVEASAHEASAGGRRYAIVTGGVLWEPMLRESLSQRGLAGQLAAIRAVAPDGGMIARDPDGALAVLAETCRASVEQDGAEAVVLGGAGLIGLAARVEALTGCTVICSVEAGLRAVLASAGARATPSRLPAPTPVESVGLSPELAALLATPRA